MATPDATIDVRDMLCAQALAVVAQSIGQLRAGEVASVHYNTDDVKHDLLVWAHDRGHQIDVAAPGILQIQIGHP